MSSCSGNHPMPQPMPPPGHSPHGRQAHRASLLPTSSGHHGVPPPPPGPKVDPQAVFDYFYKVMKKQFGEDYKEKSFTGFSGIAKLSSIHHFTKKNESARKEFKNLTSNKTLSKKELSQYITARSDLWTTLGTRFALPVPKCIEAATNVAYALALKKELAMMTVQDNTVTEKDFKHFHQNYVMNEKGSHEFFLRTIFAVFDTNNDGVWAPREVGYFLNVFYRTRYVFTKDNLRLPDHPSFVHAVLEKFQDKQQGCLFFPEARDMLIVSVIVCERDAKLKQKADSNNTK